MADVPLIVPFIHLPIPPPPLFPPPLVPRPTCRSLAAVCTTSGGAVSGVSGAADILGSPRSIPSRPAPSLIPFPSSVGLCAAAVRTAPGGTVLAVGGTSDTLASPHITSFPPASLPLIPLPQAFVLLLCALCPEELCRVRVGPLTPHTVDALRDMRAMLGVQFDIRPDESTGTVFLSCIGSGHKNLAKPVT
ncbi:unnamed protein product [Closterium sp. NIES-54]